MMKEITENPCPSAVSISRSHPNRPQHSKSPLTFRVIYIKVLKVIRGAKGAKVIRGHISVDVQCHDEGDH